VFGAAVAILSHTVLLFGCQSIFTARTLGKADQRIAKVLSLCRTSPPLGAATVIGRTLASGCL
jgi:hypothetical protein